MPTRGNASPNDKEFGDVDSNDFAPTQWIDREGQLSSQPAGSPVSAAALRSTAKSVQAALLRHPRRVVGAMATVLAGTAVTAFGIAPAAPDADLLPRSTITESIAIDGLAEQVETLATSSFELDRSTLTRSGDGVDAILRRLGVVDPAAAAFIRSDREARQLLDGVPGKMLTARTARDGRLVKLTVRFPAAGELQATHFNRLTVDRKDDGRFDAQAEVAPLTRQIRLGSGRIRSTMWAAVDEARLPEDVAEQMIEIFSGDIDFHHELKRGDTFSVVYEGLAADGQPITWNDGMGRVLAAEFVNAGEKFHAVWHQDAASGKGAYFGFDGKARRRAFLASPMDFSRVTSGFEMRTHPVLNVRRQHHGIDYAAPTGTPVKSVGDGVIEKAERQNGYGNVVYVRHFGDRTTVYAHLSKINVKPGQRIEQGAIVGLVGSTGMSTGPHLHFEFRQDGEFLDPQKVARATETITIAGAERPKFLREAAVFRQQLAAAGSIARFRSDAE